ncbi:hypothetical protein CVT24_001252 [Panaeolus cyanescens]|uniref:Ubiquitin-like domain-containing protein n=1 Tax=Panaeolus cyanescens TaxID=181874 RepID=A0A409YFX4_9AGAR|nr:hypothetical protein CVT24_001252 [Panaeolus cyanescens]
MNSTGASHQQNTPTTRLPKPPPAGPAPPAPTTAPPPPPNNSNNVNGHHPPANNTKGKKRNETPIDPATMYESLKNRIAALEEEEVLEEEEERRFAEEAQKSVKGLEDNVIHNKYIELFAEFKRLERDHAKEKQKLVKDKDAAKGQLTKANQTKTKMENLARELQKDNKRLRLARMKSDFAKRADKAKQQDVKYRESPDVVVKVVCRYRAELFFKISRKTKLSRLITSWTERMERNGGKPEMKGGENNGSKPDQAGQPAASSNPMQFIFTYNGRILEAEQTPEDVGIDEGDEILAVELMDLTEGGSDSDEYERYVEPRRELLKKAWTDDPQEAKRTIEEIFDGVIRERLKEVLRQYELRERHFECVIRSKELEVLLSRARAAEQKQLAEGEKNRALKQEEEASLIRQLRKDLEEVQNGQTMLIDKLITCCKEIIQKPNAERTQRLFASLREELERKGPRAAKKPADSPTGSTTSHVYS